MKKFAAFALVICLLVIAVAAVLSVTYPETQPKFVEFLKGVGEGIGRFFGLIFEPFRKALTKG